MKYLYQDPKAAVALYRDFLQKNNAPSPSPAKRRPSIWLFYLLLLIGAFLLTSCHAVSAPPELEAQSWPALLAFFTSLAAICACLFLAVRLDQQTKTAHAHQKVLSNLHFAVTNLEREIYPAIHINADGTTIKPANPKQAKA